MHVTEGHCSSNSIICGKGSYGVGSQAGQHDDAAAWWKSLLMHHLEPRTSQVDGPSLKSEEEQKQAIR